MLLMKAQITRKNVLLIYLSFFLNYVRAGISNSLQYLIWLKQKKTVKIYLVVESVKLLLVLSINNEQLLLELN